jgi:peptidyl-tRNA hydrolase, PTH2 family
MPPGKLASQAGHAYLNSFIDSGLKRPEINQFYQRDGIGTKVCLKAKNQDAILKAYEAAKEAGIPCSLIIDEHHIMPPHFTGDPIITALGIGPARKDEVRAFTKRFSLCQ